MIKNAKEMKRTNYFEYKERICKVLFSFKKREKWEWGIIFQNIEHLEYIIFMNICSLIWKYYIRKRGGFQGTASRRKSVKSCSELGIFVDMRSHCFHRRHVNSMTVIKCLTCFVVCLFCYCFPLCIINYNLWR